MMPHAKRKGSRLRVTQNHKIQVNSNFSRVQANLEVPLSAVQHEAVRGPRGDSQKRNLS